MPEAVLDTAADRSLATVNLLTHHIRSHRLAALDESKLTDMARYGNAAWPALCDVSQPAHPK